MAHIPHDSLDLGYAEGSHRVDDSNRVFLDECVRKDEVDVLDCVDWKTFAISLAGSEVR